MNKEQKTKLPDDVQDECLAILRGYERRKWSKRPEDVRRVEAVLLARESVGKDLPENMRLALCEAITRNCLDGRKNTWEHLGVPFISRSDFYRRRRYFLYEMAVQLGIA